MIHYDDGDFFSLLIRIEGSVIPRAIRYSIPVPVVSFLILSLNDWAPDWKVREHLSDVTESQAWNGSTLAVLILLGFRVQTAYARFWESTTLLHQMQGEWFESVSSLFTFSSYAKTEQEEEVTAFRHTLVRLMSLMHGSALEEIKDDVNVTYDVLDIMGLDMKTLLYLFEAKEQRGENRVEVLLHMIQMLMTAAHDNGVLRVAPPILTRVYQTLSRGLVDFINAQKIADTMFPFPFAQLTAMFLVLHTLFTPLIITAIISSKVLCPLVAFLPVFGMHCLNFTAMELEMPFGDDENDLPLEKLQAKMNSGLLMLIRESSDIIPGLSEMACRTFASVADTCEINCTGSWGMTSAGRRRKGGKVPTQSGLAAQQEAAEPKQLSNTRALRRSILFDMNAQGSIEPKHYLVRDSFAGARTELDALPYSLSGGVQALNSNSQGSSNSLNLNTLSVGTDFAAMAAMGHTTSVNIRGSPFTCPWFRDKATASSISLPGDAPTTSGSFRSNTSGNIQETAGSSQGSDKATGSSAPVKNEQHRIIKPKFAAAVHSVMGAQSVIGAVTGSSKEAGMLNSLEAAVARGLEKAIADSLEPTLMRIAQDLMQSREAWLTRMQTEVEGKSLLWLQKFDDQASALDENTDGMKSLGHQMANWQELMLSLQRHIAPLRAADTGGSGNGGLSTGSPAAASSSGAERRSRRTAGAGERGSQLLPSPSPRPYPAAPPMPPQVPPALVHRQSIL